jgi:hypothetical protein
MRPVRGSDRHAGLPESSKITFHRADSGTESGRDNRSRYRLSRAAEELDKPLLPLHSTQGEVAHARVPATNAAGDLRHSSASSWGRRYLQFRRGPGGVGE